MAFCKDHVSESNATAAAEPQPNSSRSPPKGAAPAAPAAEEGAAAQEAPRKQWNLRDRKAGLDFAEDGRQHKNLWNMDASGGGKKSRGFSVELTRQEIEADFLAITGRPPPRRPKKHPKSVQRQIDTLCPGSSLSEVSRDRYKVNEKGGF